MYKTLLVPVDGRSRSARSLDVACRIASMFDAHVVGLFVKPSSDLVAAGFAETYAARLSELHEQAVREMTDAAKARFDAAIRGAGQGSAEWRTAEGDLASAVALHARYADLVVINQSDARDTGASNFADSVLLTLGRPALLVPHAGEFPTVGQNVLVCWNARAEAARAVTEALPFLKRASKVTVMAVDSEASAAAHGDVPGADIALFLARHGVRADVASTPSGGVDVGNVILSRAFDLGADLIVMGAYGHSRMRELVLGGATRTVLESMTVPVLMSH
jgi:nucleotide-binding universal stress UspA family protein